MGTSILDGGNDIVFVPAPTPATLPPEPQSVADGTPSPSSESFTGRIVGGDADGTARIVVVHC